MGAAKKHRSHKKDDLLGVVHELPICFFVFLVLFRG